MATERSIVEVSAIICDAGTVLYGPDDGTVYWLVPVEHTAHCGEDESGEHRQEFFDANVGFIFKSVGQWQDDTYTSPFDKEISDAGGEGIEAEFPFLAMVAKHVAEEGDRRPFPPEPVRVVYLTIWETEYNEDGDTTKLKGIFDLNKLELRTKGSEPREPEINPEDFKLPEPSRPSPENTLYDDPIVFEPSGRVSPLNSLDGLIVQSNEQPPSVPPRRRSSRTHYRGNSIA